MFGGGCDECVLVVCMLVVCVWWGMCEVCVVRWVCVVGHVCVGMMGCVCVVVCVCVVGCGTPGRSPEGPLMLCQRGSAPHSFS